MSRFCGEIQEISVCYSVSTGYTSQIGDPAFCALRDRYPLVFPVTPTLACTLSYLLQLSLCRKEVADGVSPRGSFFCAECNWITPTTTAALRSSYFIGSPYRPATSAAAPQHLPIAVSPSPPPIFPTIALGSHGPEDPACRRRCSRRRLACRCCCLRCRCCCCHCRPTGLPPHGDRATQPRRAAALLRGGPRDLARPARPLLLSGSCGR